MTISVLSLAVGGVLPERGVRFSGAFQRQLDYGRYLSSYHVVTAVPPGRNGPLPPSRVGSTHFYPTNTSRQRAYIAAAIRIAEQVIRSCEIHCITCAEPTYTALAGIYLARKHRIPLDISLMSDIIGNPHYLAERPGLNHMQSLLARATLSFAQGIRVSTETERAKLHGRYGGRVYLSRFYVDPSAYSAVPEASVAALRERLLADGGDAAVLFVGRLVPQKNLEVLLRAMRRVHARRPRTRLVIVGSGPEARPLEALAIRLGLGDVVRFVGAVPFEEVQRYFHASDLFAITSRHEGTCMVLLEAALARRPIVAARFAGAVDLLQGLDGVTLGPVGDDRTIADGILALLEDAGLRRTLGETLRARVLANFDPERLAAERAAAWIRIAKGGPAPPGPPA